MKHIAIGVLLAISLITAAEWFFQSLEIRPTAYLAVSDYVAKDPADRLLQQLVADALADGLITTREFKPILDHVMDVHGRYQQQVDVSLTAAEARAMLSKQLESA